MNRIDQKFAELKKQGRKALITFITAGDPNLSVTQEAVLAMDRAGADLIELGVPFSDPVAEGPVIQEASQRALAAGTTLVAVFDLVKRLRQTTQKPLLLMLYLNSIYRFGKERFFSLCEQCGVDGVIVPDMPYEEKEEIEGVAETHGVYSIRLVAPTSRERAAKIAKGAKGFLYCVSSTGVTGMRSGFSTDFDEFFGQIRPYATIPCAVGFGISGPEQAKDMQRYCDGVIVGSAVVKVAAEHGECCAGPVYDFVRSLREGMDEASK